MKKCPKCGNEQEGKNQCQNCGFLFNKEKKDGWFLRLCWYCYWFIATLCILFGCVIFIGGLSLSEITIILIGISLIILGIFFIRRTKKLRKTKESSDDMKKSEEVAQDTIDTEYVTQATIDTEKSKPKVDQKFDVKKVFTKVNIRFAIGVGLLILIGTIILSVYSSKVDRKKFENLYRSGKAIDGATSVGVNYKRFEELLQNLATEISIAADKAKSGNEKKMLESYRDVLTIYKDSYLVWECKNKTPEIDGIPSNLNPKIEGLLSNLNPKIDGLLSDLNPKFEGLLSDLNPKIEGQPSDLIIINPEIKYVVKKYDLKLRTGTITIRGWTIVEDRDFEAIPEDSIQKIWLVAENLLEDTNKKYFGY